SDCTRRARAVQSDTRATALSGERPDHCRCEEGSLVVVTKVVLPKWGMGIEEGTVSRWLKAEGDRGEKGEPIVEIETAKAIQEVEAPESGTLRKILLAQGETAQVNTDIALIE